MNSPGAATTGLKMQTHTQDGATVVQCTGALTAECSGSFKDFVKELLPDSKQIVLDLKEVTRMDSAGLGAVVGLYVAARKAQSSFVLINYNKSIRDLLGITNLLSVLEACGQSGVRIP